MEGRRSSTVYISHVVNEIFTTEQQQHQQQEKPEVEEWQDLELFWGLEKQRLGEGKRRSGSLEELFSQENFLEEPETEDDLKNDLKTKTVRGEDISDIPTVYKAEGFKPQELIVIGTYVDKDILPGFRYKVRKNLSEEHLFDGKSKYLESVGTGYGKRFTFENDSSVNENDHFFWSDSRAQGYGFAFRSLGEQDTFAILDTRTGNVVGRVLVNDPAIREDQVLSTVVGERGYVEREVDLHFGCIVILSDVTNKQSLFVDDVKVKGKALVVRESFSSKAKITQIFLKDFIVDSCLLVPEE